MTKETQRLVNQARAYAKWAKTLAIISVVCATISLCMATRIILKATQTQTEPK